MLHHERKTDKSCQFARLTLEATDFDYIWYWAIYITFVRRI
jgi:hypothetical protein